MVYQTAPSVSQKEASTTAEEGEDTSPQRTVTQSSLMKDVSVVLWFEVKQHVFMIIIDIIPENYEVSPVFIFLLVSKLFIWFEQFPTRLL